MTGLTWRKKTSPNTWRWQQHAEWTADLPSRAVGNVSLSFKLYRYFVDVQPKLTRPFPRPSWTDEVRTAPQHTETAREALAEANALVDAGRAKATRSAFVRCLTAEPAIAESWLRTLVTQVR